MKTTFLLSLLFIAVIKPYPPSGPSGAGSFRVQNPLLKTDTLWANLDASIVKWKGTKFRGMGSHAGIVKLKSGYLLYEQRQLRGGTFVIDMASMENTDIPKSDPVPRQNLINHLKGKDFFQVEKYPQATFVITNVTPTSKGTKAITGNLTIKGITRSITFPATLRSVNGQPPHITASFRINRHRWGIDYKGSRLTNDLIDEDILFQVLLVARERRVGLSYYRSIP